MPRYVKSVDELVEGLHPKFRVPKGFSLWSEKLQKLWLRARQKRACRKKVTT